jgi:hypothetical protein
MTVKQYETKLELRLSPERKALLLAIKTYHSAKGSDRVRKIQAIQAVKKQFGHLPSKFCTNFDAHHEYVLWVGICRKAGQPWVARTAR